MTTTPRRTDCGRAQRDCFLPPAETGPGAILVDRTSVEAFANEGEVSLSVCFLLTDDRFAVIADGGAARVRSLRVIELGPGWGKGTKSVIGGHRRQTEDLIKW